MKTRKIILIVLIMLFVLLVIQQLLQNVWPYWRNEILYLHPGLKILVLVVLFGLGAWIAAINAGKEAKQQIDEYNKRKQK